MHPVRKILIGVAYAALLVLTSACAPRDLQVTPAAHVTPVAEAAPAPAATAAHFDNNYGTWACGSTRPHEEYTLQHAHIAAMGVYSNGVSYVRASCQAQTEQRVCFWVGESRSTGVNLVYSGYDCVIVG